MNLRVWGKWTTRQGAMFSIPITGFASEFHIEHDFCNKNYWNKRPTDVVRFLFTIGYEKFIFPPHVKNQSWLEWNCAAFLWEKNKIWLNSSISQYSVFNNWSSELLGYCVVNSSMKNRSLSCVLLKEQTWGRTEQTRLLGEKNSKFDKNASFWFKQMLELRLLHGM